MAERCPCDTGLLYAACCGRFHAGGEPPNAEALMRSRFSAFVKKDVAYLYRTLHPEHDDHAQGLDAFARSLKRHLADRVVYQRLEVLDAAPPDRDGVEKVLFVAHVKHRGKDASFAELSFFAHDAQGLRYLAGRTFSLSALGDARRIDALEPA